MQQVADQEGVYSASKFSKIFGTRMQVLKDSVPPIPACTETDANEETSPQYGVVTQGIPMPNTGGFYVVEFLDELNVRILAYGDTYGRVFAATQAVLVPPACQPSLSFVIDAEQTKTAGEQRGCVYVHGLRDKKREVALFFKREGKITLFDSWYDFGDCGQNLTYQQALARVFLACIYRPSLGVCNVPTRGLSPVFERLENASFSDLERLVHDIQSNEDDPCIKPPVIAQCFAQWLLDADLLRAAEKESGDDMCVLAKRTEYSRTYYFRGEQTETKEFSNVTWSIESAINRFLLASEALGGAATLATEEDCNRWDTYVFDSVATQPLTLEKPAGHPVGEESGDWEAISSICAAFESVRLPVRVSSVVKADVSAGAVGLDVLVCHAQTKRMRDYALRIGLLMSHIVFQQSSPVQRVDLVIRFMRETAQDDSEAMVFPNPRDREGSAYVTVTFLREAYNQLDGFEMARSTNPRSAYKICGAEFNLSMSNAFSYLESLPSYEQRHNSFGVDDDSLVAQEGAYSQLDANWDMNISYDAVSRRLAENLADKIVLSESVSEAMKIVKEAQEKASAVHNDKAVLSCINLMAALAEDTCDMSDQNAIVSSFLGEDRCLTALNLAKAVAQTDPDKAVEILIEAIREVAALEGCIDGSNVVYRVFDSPVSRVVYNNVRRTGEGHPQSAVLDQGKRLEMAPDSFYLCHLEIARLLERSFERSDEALYYGNRAVELAPSTAASYRQLGRMYMLVGNMEQAIYALREGLNFAVHPNEIAMLYYQLGYAFWKSDSPYTGAVCYLKSLDVSSSMAVQVAMELHELIEETGIGPVNPKTLDEELARAGVPVAPTSDLLDSVGEAAAVAVDKGLFATAAGLLTIYLCYRHDAALVNVLRSLGE